MYCSSCGKQNNDQAQFCPYCGQAHTAGKMSAAVTAGAPVYGGQPAQPVPAQPHGGTAGSLIGYSSRINDPAFARYIKNTKRWAVLFSLIIAVIAIVGFYIAGETGSEMENPQSLYIGLGIGGMFILIALIQVLSKRKKVTWDGVVVDKRIEKKRQKEYYGSGDNESYRWVNYLLYSVMIRSQEGKIHTLSAKDDDTQYNYYQIGDHVRHHGGLGSFEKYDKSRDTIIFCNACSNLNDIHSDVCFRCKCPLLK